MERSEIFIRLLSASCGDAPTVGFQPSQARHRIIVAHAMCLTLMAESILAAAPQSEADIGAWLAAQTQGA